MHLSLIDFNELSKLKLLEAHEIDINDQDTTEL